MARVVKAGAVILEEPPRTASTGFTAEAIKEAEKLGAELRDLNLPKTKSGQTMINAQSLVRAIRQHQAKPIAEPTEDRIPRAVDNFPSGEITVDGALWFTLEQTKVDPAELKRDAELITSFIESYGVFFGDAKGAVDHYWAFLVWLYGAPAAPYLRQAAIPADISKRMMTCHIDAAIPENRSVAG